MKSNIFIGSFLLCTAIQAQKTDFKFQFRDEKISRGYTSVLPTDTFSAVKGFGFDLGSTPAAGNQPFYFSVAVPEGNYRVRFNLGTDRGRSVTTIKAESRRLLCEHVVVEKGRFVNKTFTVNTRRREINATEKVSLKPRELNKLDWDDKLTFEFNDSLPALWELEITKVTDATTVFLAGNSTVVDQGEEPWASWGQMIPRFFNDKVAIANHAESGLTLGSFIGSKRLDKVMSVMKPGDYLFIEFGHNDQKEKGPNDGAFKSYTERLQRFIRETKQKGGIPVVVTSTSRRAFDDNGKTINTLGDYPAAAKQVAKGENVALIDLNAMTATLYDALGVEPSKKAFVHYPANTWPGQDKALADNTHFNPYGAYEIAKCIVEGIKQQQLGIARYLLNDTPAFDPAHPDNVDQWRWPVSPASSLVKPDGN
jgi:lysophospholipase L1-like esterase